LGHFIDAEQHLSEALDSGDAWVDQNRPVLEESRKAVRAELGSVELRGLRADTIVQIAGRAAVPAPGDGIIWVIPGKTTLRITAPKRETITKEAVLAAGGRIAIDVEIQPEQEQVSAENRKNGTALPAARPPPGNLNMLQSVSDHGGSNDGAHDRPVPPWKRWWFWTAAGAVVVGGAVTAVLLLRKDPGCRAGEVCSSL
jgi:hypothetical protein